MDRVYFPSLSFGVMIRSSLLVAFVFAVIAIGTFQTIATTAKTITTTTTSALQPTIVGEEELFAYQPYAHDTRQNEAEAAAESAEEAEFFNDDSNNGLVEIASRVTYEDANEIPSVYTFVESESNSNEETVDHASVDDEASILLEKDKGGKKGGASKASAPRAKAAKAPKGGLPLRFKG